MKKITCGIIDPGILRVIRSEKTGRNLEMENSRISILVGRNDPEAKDLGMKLRSSGAEVCYSKHSALEIQHEALIRKPDALILTSLTKHTDELCTLLKRSDHAPLIVVFSDDTVMSDDRYRPACADLVLEHTDSARYDKLFKKLFGRTQPQQDTLTLPERQIAETLFEFCITKNYNGYSFIKEAIKLASCPGTFSRCISKDIYPEIAAKFKVTACCVERNIRTAIRSSWAKSGAAVKREFFGPFTLDPDWMPTNSEFIFIVADRLTLRMGGHI